MVGLGNSEKACIGSVDRFVVAVGTRLGGALFGEFGNVGARDEGLAAGAGDDDDADALVVARIHRGSLGGFPHVERHGVVTLRIVEGQIADAALPCGTAFCRWQSLSHVPLFHRCMDGLIRLLCSSAISSSDEAEFLEHLIGVLAHASAACAAIRLWRARQRNRLA